MEIGRRTKFTQKDVEEFMESLPVFYRIPNPDGPLLLANYPKRPLRDSGYGSLSPPSPTIYPSPVPVTTPPRTPTPAPTYEPEPGGGPIRSRPLYGGRSNLSFNDGANRRRHRSDSDRYNGDLRPGSELHDLYCKANSLDVKGTAAFQDAKRTIEEAAVKRTRASSVPPRAFGLKETADAGARRIVGWEQQFERLRVSHELKSFSISKEFVGVASPAAADGQIQKNGSLSAMWTGGQGQRYGFGTQENAQFIGTNKDADIANEEGRQVFNNQSGDSFDAGAESVDADDLDILHLTISNNELAADAWMFA